MQVLAAGRSFRKTFSLLGQAASAFYTGLFLLSGSTMIYEIMLARLLSVVTWYYLALAAVGMAMSGMTAGALVVQLKPSFFERALHERRVRQGAFAMALALPLGLVGTLAVPLALSRSMETVFSFSLFTVFAGLPFFFSGIVVCLALTRSPLPIGKLYLADLFGAATGCDPRLLGNRVPRGRRFCDQQPRRQIAQAQPALCVDSSERVEIERHEPL